MDSKLHNYSNTVFISECSLALDDTFRSRFSTIFSRRLTKISSSTYNICRARCRLVFQCDPILLGACTVLVRFNSLRNDVKPCLSSTSVRLLNWTSPFSVWTALINFIKCRHPVHGIVSTSLFAETLHQSRSIPIHSEDLMSVTWYLQAFSIGLITLLKAWFLVYIVWCHSCF